MNFKRFNTDIEFLKIWNNYSRLYANHNDILLARSIFTDENFQKSNFRPSLYPKFVEIIDRYLGNEKLYVIEPLLALQKLPTNYKYVLPSSFYHIYTCVSIDGQLINVSDPNKFAGLGFAIYYKFS